MEEWIGWDLEAFLLDPSNENNQKKLEFIKNKFETFINKYDGPLKYWNEELFVQLLEFLDLVKNLRFYEALLCLDKMGWNHPFVAEKFKDSYYLGVQNFYHSIFNSTIERLELVKEREGNLDVLTVLGASILFLKVFIRVNWVGPGFSVSQESEKVLSEKYENMVPPKESDNGNFLTDSTIDLLSNLEVGDSRKSFLMNKLHQELESSCILRSPELSLKDPKITKDQKEFLKAILEKFTVDGETVYYGVSGIQYLYPSFILMNALDKYIEGTLVLKSLEIWRCRLAHVWQLIVEDSIHNPCKTLYRCTILNFVNILKKSQTLEEDFGEYPSEDALASMDQEVDADGADERSPVSTVLKFRTFELNLDRDLKSFFLIELAQKLPLYNLNRLYGKLFEKISVILEFNFEFTGKMGIRRKNQKKSIPQLVVEYKKENSTKEEFKEEGETPINIKLEELGGENDILETPKLDEEDLQEKLEVLEQLFMLSKGLHILRTTPQNDELGLEFINTIATTCLREETTKKRNWLVTSTSLWLRCKSEYLKTKKVERATSQLHCISESYNESKPENRIEYFFGVTFPPTWDIKKEIGKHMFYIGSFSTAFQMYKDLHLWEDAIKCLLLSGRKNEARELVLERIKTMPTAQMYCYLGDVENNADHYHKAWEISGGKSARAMRSLGARSYSSGKYEEAIEYMKKAYSLNYMNRQTHAVLGASYLKTYKFSEALSCFLSLVSLDPENADAWANVATCHIRTDRIDCAKTALLQAIKYNNAKWQFWEMLLKIAVMTRDIQWTCNSVRKLIELGRKAEVDPRVVSFLVSSWTAEKNRESVLIEEALRVITDNVTENAEIWSHYAKYLTLKKDHVGALEAVFKEYRKIEQEIGTSSSERKDTEELQTDFEVNQVKKLTNSLSSMVGILSSMSETDRDQFREKVLMTLKVSKDRLESRNPELNGGFVRELSLMIERVEGSEGIKEPSSGLTNHNIAK